MEDFDSLNEKQLESLERGLSDLKNNRIIPSNEFWKGLLSNKEQQEIILDVYREHCLEQSKYLRHGGTIQEFINKCKTDQVFSEKWGLTIEERELRQFERVKLLQKAWKNNGITPEHEEVSTIWVEYKNLMEKYNIPTQIIIVTYQTQKIKSYE
jgi:hypothetical protein